MLTLEEHDCLADIAWYIKGLIDADDTTFSRDHVKALKSAMADFKNGNRSEEKE